MLKRPVVVVWAVHVLGTTPILINAEIMMVLASLLLTCAVHAEVEKLEV